VKGLSGNRVAAERDRYYNALRLILAPHGQDLSDRVRDIAESSMTPNASGTSGPLGAIADRFDQIPVRGKLMTTLVSVIALVALAATNAHAIHLVGKPDCAKNDGLTDVYSNRSASRCSSCASAT
jgi:hypothetical protein